MGGIAAGFDIGDEAFRAYLTADCGHVCLGAGGAELIDPHHLARRIEAQHHYRALTLGNEHLGEFIEGRDTYAATYQQRRVARG